MSNSKIYGERKKRYRKLEFLQEGEYDGVITEVASSQTLDGETKFLNVYISTKCGKFDTVLQKSFVKNVGRNFELVTFLQDAGVLEDGGRVCYEDLEGMMVSFKLTLYGNKPKLSDFVFYDEEDLEEDLEEDDLEEDDDEDIDFGED